MGNQMVIDPHRSRRSVSICDSQCESCHGDPWTHDSQLESPGEELIDPMIHTCIHRVIFLTYFLIHLVAGLPSCARTASSNHTKVLWTYKGKRRFTWWFMLRIMNPISFVDSWMCCSMSNSCTMWYSIVYIPYWFTISFRRTMPFNWWSMMIMHPMTFMECAVNSWFTLLTALHMVNQWVCHE